jgi:hypothetical protein
MKKRLEAELISIAHRVLKLKNKSEVDQLYLETQKLYETLSVLKFYGDHIEQVKSTISEAELEEKLSDSLDDKSIQEQQIEQANEEVTSPEAIEAVTETSEKEAPQVVQSMEENEVIKTDDNEEEIATPEEPIIVGEITLEEEEIEEENTTEAQTEIDNDPIFEMATEVPVEKNKPTQQISFEDFLGDSYNDVEFVKPNDITKPPAKAELQEEITETLVENKEEKKQILNEKLAVGINIGLNDRIGFVKYLFDNSSEDFNRVLSQLNTFDSYSEAEDFINEMVKPDYNNWQGNEDYADRFMEIVAQKFN